MNILHLRASNFYGGPERQLHIHARLALKSDFSITVGSFLEAGQEPEYLQTIKQDGITTICFPVSSAYDTTAISLVRKYIVDREIAVLCTHDYRSSVIGWLAKRKTPAKWVVFSRGWTQENPKVRFYHLLDKSIIRCADKIVAVSARQGERIRRLMVPQRKITVVHNAIDVSLFSEVDPIDLRREFSLPKNSIVAVTAGRFSAEKGQLLLIEAAAEASRYIDEFHLIMYGDGPDLSRARELVRRLGMERQFLLPGYSSQVIGALKGADFLINPSFSEGLPNVVLEAMAVGIPVLATAVGGIPELIAHKETGYLVPAGNRAALTDAIIYFCEHHQDIRGFAERALREVKNRFTFEQQNEKLCDLYRQMTS